MKNYDFKKVNLQLGLYTLDEFDKGGIEFKLTKDLYSVNEGAGGEVSRSKLNGIHGELIVRLKVSSASNTDMNALYLLDQTGNGGVVPMMLKDNSSDGTLISCPSAFLRTPPVVKYSTEEDMLEYIFFCADCLVNLTGYTA